MDATKLSRVVDEQIRRLEEHEIKIFCKFQIKAKKGDSKELCIELSTG